MEKTRDYVVSIPENVELAEAGESGKNLWSISPDNAVVRQLDAFLDQVERGHLARMRAGRPRSRLHETP